MLAKNLGGTVQRSKDHQFEIGFYDIKPTGDGHKIFQNQKYKFKKKCPLSGKEAPIIDYKNII